MRLKKNKTRWVPPYERMVVRLRDLVCAQEKSTDAFLGTEVALAETNGVSRMTMRKAVNALVAEGLVERRAGVGLFVRRAESTGYIYRALFGNLFWDPAIKSAGAMRRTAEKVGAQIEYFDAGGDEERFLREIAALPTSGAKGAVIFSQHGKAFDAAVRTLAQKGFPFVVIDEVVEVEGVASVVSDNRMGGVLAGAELLNAGHRELAFVGDVASDTVARRWMGFETECRAHGVRPRKYDVRSARRLGDWTDEVRTIVERILRLKVRPTAVFCSCDAIARIVMRRLAEAGVRSPEDVSLVGFDDDPIAEWTTPALTTIRQDFALMGRRAFETLVRCVAHPSCTGGMEVLPVALIRRESVCRATTQKGCPITEAKHPKGKRK